MSSSRLQLFQAFLLSLELDLWHDEDSCLYRAGRLPDIIPIVSHGNKLDLALPGMGGIINSWVKLLRRELRDRPFEPADSPLAADEEKELARKWSLWVNAESQKRSSIPSLHIQIIILLTMLPKAYDPVVRLR